MVGQSALCHLQAASDTRIGTPPLSSLLFSSPLFQFNPACENVQLLQLQPRSSRCGALCSEQNTNNCNGGRASQTDSISVQTLGQLRLETKGASFELHSSHMQIFWRGRHSTFGKYAPDRPASSTSVKTISEPTSASNLSVITTQSAETCTQAQCSDRL